MNKKLIPGLVLCIAIAIPATWLGQHFPIIGGPIFAIAIGVLIALRLPNRARYNSGVSFASKKILQLAVILLGFGMNLVDILDKGVQSLPIIITTITTSFIIAFIMFKVLKTPAKTTTLIGVGSAICGGSAIAATAPVINADDDEIAQAISVIFFFNVLAAIIFPTLGGMLGLSNSGFGIFAGTAVNDTSSVIATATAWDGLYGSNTLASATIIKLTRTLAIIPITIFLAFYQSKNTQQANKVKMHKVFPFFILFFVLASVITTVFTLPADVVAPFKEASKFFIIMAMAAIGINTNIVKLVTSGKKPLLIGFCCWVGISVVCLGIQFLCNLF